MKNVNRKLVLLSMSVLLFVGNQVSADHVIPVNSIGSLAHRDIRDINFSTGWGNATPSIQNMFPSLDSVRFRLTPNVKKSFRYVGLGDSYGAGQGAPNNVDRPEREHLKIPWLEDLASDDKKPTWDNRQCRRSNKSAFARAFNNLKNYNYGNSTLGNLVDMHFESYACSGSTTNEFFNSRTGLGEKYDMVPPSNPITAQFTQLKNAWADDSIDALVMSIGGNDVGFGEAIMVSVLGNIACSDQPFSIHCLSDLPFDNKWLRDVCVDLAGLGITTTATCLATVQGIYVSKKNALIERRNDWKNTLLGNYSRINTTLMGRAYDFIRRNEDGTKNIFIMEYPDALHSDSGHYCDPKDIVGEGLLNGDKFFEALTKEEVVWLGDKIYTPLIETIGKAAADNNWTVVKVSEDSKEHGLCTSDRFINQNIDALKRQGADVLPPISISGGLIHPNDAGYKFMGDRLFEKLKPLVTEKLELKASELPTRISPEVINGKLKIHWDDNSDKEDKYIIVIDNRWQNRLVYNVNADTNEYSLEVSDLSAHFPEGIVYVDLSLVGPGGLFRSNTNPINLGIPIAFKKPSTPWIHYTKKIFSDYDEHARGRTPKGIMLSYDSLKSRGIAQIIAWANVDENVTIRDLNNKQINWIEYDENANGDIQNTKKTDASVNVYYTWNKEVGYYNIARLNKVFASIKLCNNIGCSGWSPTIEAHPVTVFPGSPTTLPVRPSEPRHDTNINTNPIILPTSIPGNNRIRR